jgi:transcriptional regulator with XRE-family HTH domain
MDDPKPRQRMIDRRKAKGLTQDELAERSGVPQSTISKVERGAHVPAGDTLAKLCDALGMKHADLLWQDAADPTPEPSAAGGS